MAEADTGWEDLFAKAAGEDKPSEDGGGGDPETDDPRFRVPTRSFAPILPLSTRLGPGFLACSKGWKPKSDGARCKRCKLTPIHHVLEPVDSEQSVDWKPQAYCSLRNIRCCVVLSLLENKDDSERKRKALWKHAKEESTHLSILQGTKESHRGTFSIQDTADDVSRLRSNLDDGFSFERSISQISICDALYYRLFYLLTISATHRKETWLPNPAEYFVVDPIVRERAESEIRNLNLDEELLERFNLRNESKEPSDPLAFAHRQRLHETIALFRGSWLEQESTKRAFEACLLEASISAIENHETPAPKAVSEWRDSCRDSLCNFYAFATLGPRTYEGLRSCLFEHDIKQVVEVGAGTGYVAELLSQHGFSLEAYDIRPPDQASNEYHGLTVPYFPVKKGGVSVLTNAARSTTALLLCYPPPRSTMAFDALKTFLNHGGRCLVHVGEFKGLTAGPSDFEGLLLNEMDCIARFPCPTWITDATDCTVWLKRQSDTEVALLLPCSNCGRKESKYRCRLLRFLVYCSEDCFRHHSGFVRKAFRLSIIGLDSDFLEVSNPLHFSVLPSTVRLDQRRKQKRKRKRR